MGADEGNIHVFKSMDVEMMVENCPITISTVQTSI